MVDLVVVKFEKNDCVMGVMGVMGAFTFSVSHKLPSAAGSLRPVDPIHAREL